MTFEQQKNTKAIVWTVGIHALLLLVFLLCKYSLPAQPKVEDLGMEVNLGTSTNGYGTDQPENTDEPSSANATVALKASASSAASEKEINTTDDEDAPAVNIRHNKPDAKPKNHPEINSDIHKNKSDDNNNTAHNKVAIQKPRFVYQGATGKGGNGATNNNKGSNEGIGTGNGDMGVPHGTPGASNYSGLPGAGGTSMRISLDGRTLVDRPDPKAVFNEGGRVVVHVTVDRDGNISNYRIDKAANATIRAIAISKLKHVKFNKSATAPVEQFGDITFDFRATRG